MPYRLLIGLLIALSVSLARADNDTGSPEEAAAFAKNYVPNSFTSRAQAEDWLTRAQAEKTAIEDRYARADWACYDRFFVFHCLRGARDERISALASVDPIIVDANRYIRKLDYEDRMRDLNERNREKDAQIEAREKKSAQSGS